MITFNEVASLVVNGMVSALPLLGVTVVLRRYARVILASALIIAAILYVSFAWPTAGLLWLLIELVGVGIFGAMAVLGVRRSAWWLVAGWGLHPLWDIPLHFFGPGHTFAPVNYTISCLGFDLIVAGFVAFGILSGWKHFSTSTTKGEAPKVSMWAAR